MGIISITILCNNCSNPVEVHQWDLKNAVCKHCGAEYIILQSVDKHFENDITYHEHTAGVRQVGGFERTNTMK